MEMCILRLLVSNMVFENTQSLHQSAKRAGRTENVSLRRRLAKEPNFQLVILLPAVPDEQSFVFNYRFAFA